MYNKKGVETRFQQSGRNSYFRRALQQANLADVYAEMLTSRSGIWWQSPLSGADGSRDETGATEVSGASTMSPTHGFLLTSTGVLRVAHCLHEDSPIPSGKGNASQKSTSIASRALAFGPKSSLSGVGRVRSNFPHGDDTAHHPQGFDEYEDPWHQTGLEEDNDSGRYVIEGRIFPLSDYQTSQINWQANTRIHINGGELIGFVKKDGSFIVHNVPSGSYIIEVLNPEYTFEPVRVEINLKGKYRARKVNHIQTSLVIQVPYPLRMKALAKTRYFQMREQWRITDFIFNPMVLMMVLPLLLVMVLPKMMNDPETKKEMEQIQSLTKFELPEMSDMTCGRNFNDIDKSKKALTKISTERDPEHRVLSRAEPRSVVSKCLAIMANPRKFSEKIALHTHRQAEETARFEQIMREVSDATARLMALQTIILLLGPDRCDLTSTTSIPNPADVHGTVQAALNSTAATKTDLKKTPVFSCASCALKIPHKLSMPPL
ncbi:hypothetical protein GEV33_008663 [Tenebrio molitor]|uniref:ER membrane protein complex subunit 7 beta-sandwich domain-containing protein n=1 Tax=Tenebrio molitor TaxID=7067 RepID=A0A8J6HIB2_TENMO|nr:hypothetical protein GEV33_008663 [Tenebrio molitor]